MIAKNTLTAVLANLADAMAGEIDHFYDDAAMAQVTYDEAGTALRQAAEVLRQAGGPIGDLVRHVEERMRRALAAEGDPLPQLDLPGSSAGKGGALGRKDDQSPLGESKAEVVGVLEDVVDRLAMEMIGKYDMNELVVLVAEGGGMVETFRRGCLTVMNGGGSLPDKAGEFAQMLAVANERAVSKGLLTAPPRPN